MYVNLPTLFAYILGFDIPTSSFIFIENLFYYLVSTDASVEAMGAVLSQIQHNREVVIGYWSRQFSKPQRSYSTKESEALAAVATVKEFYPYLYGFEFTLVTHHNPSPIKDVGGRLTLFLQPFNFTIKYKPGIHNTTLSRIPPLSTITTTVPSIQSILGFIDIQKAQEDDKYLAQIIKAVKMGTPSSRTHWTA